VRSAGLLLAACCWLGGDSETPAREYYVATGGRQAADTNPGTRAAPFKTVAQACAVAGPGDTVFLDGGTYRETLRPRQSGAAGQSLRFVAVPGQQVTLSGADALAGVWQRHQGSIYKLQTKLKFTQLFLAAQMMPEARWPNTPSGELMTYARGAAGEGTDYETLADTHLPPGDWNGGLVLLWPGSRWVSVTRRIADYRPGQSLRFDRTLEAKRKDPYHTHDPHRPQAGNPYLLYGSLAGLDAPGEWFFDEARGTVYFWPPDGRMPSPGAVSVKQRDYGCDLRGLKCIEIRGLDIFGAAVNMTDAQDCRLEDCRLRYVEHYREVDTRRVPAPLNTVTGRNNEWRRCLIAYAATTGLRIGGTNNRLVNSIVHDVNYLGTGRGGLDLGHSVEAAVVHCSVFRAGRDTIQHHGSRRIRIEYCDIYHTNLLNNDSGAVYCWGTDGQGGVIAYNWVHDNLGDATVGIYLDNFSKKFVVHHNVVWNCTGSGIRLNSDALNHQVYNNTIQQVREPFGTYCYAKYTPTMLGTRIVNNLVNEALHPKSPSEFVQGELGPRLEANGPGAVDRDGSPVAGSAAIDAGVVIPGITDGFQGKAPDRGAYEFGGPRWRPGADWQDPTTGAAPARNLAYTPRGPVTAATMIADGLALWFDAADRATLDLASDGTVRAWRDKSPGKHVARPALGPVKFEAHALGGKPAVRGRGTGKLRVDDLHGEPGPLVVFVVSQATEATGPAWQRVVASFNGTGKEWESPNWMIGHPSHGKPATYPPQVFTLQPRQGAALSRISLLGASASSGQSLAGDIAEMLVFRRALRFDEFEAVERYLKTKWGIAD
jgi:hypothetical protein